MIITRKRISLFMPAGKRSQPRSQGLSSGVGKKRDPWTEVVKVCG